MADAELEGIQPLREGIPHPSQPGHSPDAVTRSEEAAEPAGLSSWQSRLLPLMTGMLVLLTAFFIIATFVQALSMQRQIGQAGSEASRIGQELLLQSKGELKLDELRWNAAVRLEEYAIHRRYYQASLILMSRVWIIYLGFVTGMILALVGATFILGKVRESPSQFGADSSLWKFSISTASPGLILAVLGTTLMITTMIIRAEVTVNDVPLYVRPEVRLGGSTQPPPREIPDSADTSKKPTADDSSLDDLDRKAKSRSGANK